MSDVDEFQFEALGGNHQQGVSSTSHFSFLNEAECFVLLVMTL